jgi:hypothetical protein
MMWSKRERAIASLLVDFSHDNTAFTHWCQGGCRSSGPSSDRSTNAFWFGPSPPPAVIGTHRASQVGTDRAGNKYFLHKEGGARPRHTLSTPALSVSRGPVEAMKRTVEYHRGQISPE